MAQWIRLHLLLSYIHGGSNLKLKMWLLGLSFSMIKFSPQKSSRGHRKIGIFFSNPISFGSETVLLHGALERKQNIFRSKWLDVKPKENGRESWPSSYGWWLMFERSRVWIPAWYTGWTFFSHWFVVKLYCLLEKTKNKRKRARCWPIFKNLNRIV